MKNIIVEVPYDQRFDPFMHTEAMKNFLKEWIKYGIAEQEPVVDTSKLPACLYCKELTEYLISLPLPRSVGVDKTKEIFDHLKHGDNSYRHLEFESFVIPDAIENDSAVMSFSITFHFCKVDESQRLVSRYWNADLEWRILLVDVHNV